MNRPTTFRNLVALIWGFGILFLVSSVFGWRPGDRGADAIAGAILIGAGLVARAISERAEAGKSRARSAFAPDDLMAETLDTQAD